MSTTIKLAVGAGVLALVLAAGAAANGAWRFINIRRNEAGVFRPGAWACNNYGSRIECQSGDAFPFAIATSTAKAGITVKVVRLSGAQRGHVRTVRDRHGHLVYIFSAF